MYNEIHIFLLDDNALFLSELQNDLQTYLAEHFSCVCRLDAFTTLDSLLQLAESTAPDLLISDIDLNNSVNGIAGVRSLQAIAPNCSIIYLTSYLEYATEIFETEPLYFVLKEQYREKLPAALQKFFERYQKSRQKLQLHTGGKHVTITVYDILYCEHIGKSVRIVCQDGEYSVRSSLPDFYSQLSDLQFALCHKSFLVNLAHVRCVTSLHVTMDNGTELNISRSCRDAFRKAHSRWISSLL